jgi:glycosyltransferase involved in cell wall biosynthesis
MHRFLLVGHTTPITGPIHYLRDFLTRQASHVTFVEHPLNSYLSRSTVITVNGSIVRSVKRNNFGLFNLIIDFFISFYYALTSKYTHYIGANNFDVMPAIVARLFRVNRQIKVVYFASDYSGARFGNVWLDWIYLKVEKIALKYSDVVVSNTKRAETKRLELGLTQRKSIVVSNGVFIQNRNLVSKNIDKTSFIYVGNVTKEHGLYELIEALSPAIKKIVIIGRGDDWERVTTLIETLGIAHEFYFNKPHDFVIEYLMSFEGIGLAPYNSESEWTFYCSPLKVNEYIATGVPVIISTVPEIGEHIEQFSLGIRYSALDKEEILSKLKKLDVTNFTTKANDFYDQFNYDYLYSKIPL